MNLFRRLKDYKRFLDSFEYYRKDKPSIKYSRLRHLSTSSLIQALDAHNQKLDQVSVLAYCLMPNHFHFLVKQRKDRGIETWMRWASNSYSSYFNAKYHRKGYVFQNIYKAVHVSYDEQLLQTFRYIHLNPVTAGLVKIDQLGNFEWSSYQAYVLGQKLPITIETKILNRFFADISDLTQFTMNYQEYLKSTQDFKDIFLE